MKFNWVIYLSIEFLANYQESQDESKTFQYSWLFLSIIIVAWDFQGHSVSSHGERFVGGYTIRIPLGNTGCHMHYTDQSLLGVDGGVHSHGHQPEAMVVTKCV